MGLESGVGIGIYVAGFVMLFQVIAEKFPEKRRWAFRLSLAIALSIVGAVFMTYSTVSQ